MQKRVRDSFSSGFKGLAQIFFKILSITMRIRKRSAGSLKPKDLENDVWELIDLRKLGSGMRNQGARSGIWI